MKSIRLVLMTLLLTSSCWAGASLKSFIEKNELPDQKDLLSAGESDSRIIVRKEGEGDGLIVVVFLNGGSIFEDRLFTQGRIESLRVHRGTIVKHSSKEITEYDLINLHFLLERNEIAFLPAEKRKSWVIDRSSIRYQILLSESDKTQKLSRELGESIPVDTFVTYVEWLSMM